jgi:hypothetical protein
MLPDNQGETETGPGIAINIIYILDLLLCTLKSWILSLRG